MWQRDRKTTIKTMHGELAICRPYWYCRRCGHGECPSDAKYGINNATHRMTKAVKLEAIYFAQNQGSFDRAASVLKRVYRLEINRESIRELAETTGMAVFLCDSENAQDLLNNIHNTGVETAKADGTVYIMIDGAAVNTRIEDENGSTWRENKTVIAFSSKDMIRRKNGGSIITHKEIAPLIGSSEEFKKHVLDVAVKAGYGRYKDTVVIADGATWIRSLCDELFPDATQILDLYHLKENIHTFAKHLHGHNAARAVPWVEMLIDKIEKGFSLTAILAQIPNVTALPEGVPNLRTYITNNRSKIDYPTYKRRGFFVGSGAMESTNKTIVHQRLKQAGMRWGVPGAQAMLTLRAKEESGRWHEVERCCA